MSRRRIVSAGLVVGLLVAMVAPAHEQGPLRDISDPTVISSISREPGDEGAPALVSDGVGTWMVTWDSTTDHGGILGTDADVLYAVSTDDGLSWSQPRALDANACSDSADDGSPTLATDGAGTWMAVWTSEGDILYSVSKDKGASWSATACINDPNGLPASGARIATDGAGTWLVAWFSGDDLGGTIGQDSDILYSLSNDEGDSWSSAAVLNANAGSDLGSDFSPVLTTDGAGTWIAVWFSNEDLVGTIGSDADILCAISTDDGLSWGSPRSLNTNAESDSGSDTFPSVTTDRMGTWTAVWASHNNLGGTVGDDNDVLFAVSTDAGLSWSPPSPLASSAVADADSDVTPTIVTDRMGIWVATWRTVSTHQGLGSNWRVFYVVSSDAGLTWSPPSLFNTSGSTERVMEYGAAVASSGGAWIAAWTSTDRPNEPFRDEYDILFTVSTNGFPSWSAPTALDQYAPDNGRDEVPVLRSDGAGTWMAVWESTDSLGGTTDTEKDIVYAVSTDAGASWSLPAVIDTSPDEATGWNHDPALATDSAGTWIVTWTTHNNGHVVGVASTDAGASWSSPASISGAPALDSCRANGDSTIATDRGGTWMVAWASGYPGYEDYPGDFDIFCTVSTDAGVSWSPPALVSTDGEPYRPVHAMPALATDGAGTWICAWSASPSYGEYGQILYAVSRDAGTSWSTPVLLNSDPETCNSGFAPTLATDGSGMWVTAWRADGWIFYCVSIDDGASWSSAGFLNSMRITWPGGSASPALVTDGAGGWIAVWDSAESHYGGREDANIYYSVSTNGAVSWTPSAILNHNVVNADANDLTPALATDGAGHWVYAWQSNDPLNGRTGGLEEIFVSTFSFPRYSTADFDQDFLIDLSELLRLVQFFNSGGYHCDPVGEDGYAPGPGDESCAPHDSDYAPPDWRLSLSEVLRLVQLYNAGGYYPCPDSEDGFCPGSP